MLAVAVGVWWMLLTRVDGNRDGPARGAMGPKGTLVRASGKPAWSVNETRTRIRWPVSASTAWYCREPSPTSVSAPVSASTRSHW